MTTRDDLEAMSTKELYDQAIAVARRRLDVGFFWDLLKALPVAEEIIGEDQRSKTDIRRPLALLNDLLYDADSGPLGEALRPMYVDYLLEHRHRGEAGDEDGSEGEGPSEGEETSEGETAAEAGAATKADAATEAGDDA